MLTEEPPCSEGLSPVPPLSTCPLLLLRLVVGEGWLPLLPGQECCFLNISHLETSQV